MRLTLRTLLAYMDDILEPADHEDLGKKIESSDFASELIHRCRDTVRRLRLGAPAVLASDGEDVLGSEMTADANTVSEYLDNTLPAEAVAEFERICLEPGVEADIHLAEVSSCHHILTMVLGEPAEIDMRIRERMYALPTELASGKHLRLEPAHQGRHAAEPPAMPSDQPVMPVSPPVQVGERETEVPDYLRAASRARRSRIRWLTAAAILVMVSGVAYLVLWPVPEPELPAELAQGGMVSPDGGLEIGELEIGGPEMGSPTASTEASATGGNDSQAPPFIPGEAPPFEPPSPDVAAESDVSDIVVEPIPSMENPSLPTTDTDEVVTESEDTSAKIADSPPTQPDLPEPPQDSVDLADEPGTTEDTDVEASETDLADVPPPPVPEGPVQLGNYLGGSGDVLLRREEASGKWIRLPPRTAISAGDRLLVLPKFRTHIALADSNLYLSGGTQLVLSESEQPGGGALLTLNIVYGRLLVNAGLNGCRQLWQVGDEQREVQLGGSVSLAVEVRRVFVPGGNLEEETAPIEASWYLTSGSIEWPSPAGGTQTISAPATWKTIEGVDELPQPIEELPDWIDREEITDMERRARSKLAEELEPGKAVGITLLELNDPRDRGRQREVRTLAAEASLYVGEFEPFVKSLSDTDQSRYWDSHIDSLREALALSPAVASRVREAFVNLRGQEAADDLMEMVQGYDQEAVGQTRDELQQGALVKLLGWLDSDSLDYRVLAIYNLNEITGTSYLAGYRPDSDSTQRKRALRKLWDRFESNELLPATP